MKNKEFWDKVEERTRENLQINRGGMPNGLAYVMEWIGLRFLWVGTLTSGLFALFLWLFHYQTLMNVVRVMIWR